MNKDSTSSHATQQPDGAAAPLLGVQDLRVEFAARRAGSFARHQAFRAVDGVSFEVARGEALGLVGESGCGKTTVLRAIMRLIEPEGGRVIFDGSDVLSASHAELRTLRRKMQLIFQDPAGSLDSRMRIGAIVAEPLLVHRVAGREKVRARVAELLARCGLPRDAAQRFPHEFSGGQRQRIAIARALALHPALLCCDEPTSALDVSIQAQILNLLRDLRTEFHLSLLFVSHDMAVVNHVCDRIAVMRAGQIVEIGTREQIIHDPQHPYTKALLAAVPQAVAVH